MRRVTGYFAVYWIRKAFKFVFLLLLFVTYGDALIPD
jgi:hypothetical protein